MTHPSKIVVWFRRDLRLSDNPALAQAVAEKAEIVPLFIFDPYLLNHPETGSGRVQFLLGCLDSLQKNLEHLGSTLLRRYGNQPQVLLEVAAEVGADAVYWNEDTEREWRTRTDCCAIEALEETGIKVRCFQSEAVSPAGGKESYALKFFTPQWYRFLQEPIALRHTHLPSVQLSASTCALKTLEDLGLPMTAQTVPVAGEREAHRLLNEFLDRKVSRYLKSLSVATQASQYTSRLGAHIKFGTISVRTIYKQVLLKRQFATAWDQRNLDGFISRLFWRDHFAQKLRNLPRCETESYLEAFDSVLWSQNDQHYRAWCEGKTGYPLVDAAMRCLNATGWLPFRLRALCATFLCIDLFLPWQWGAKHYMQQLIDGDVAIDHWQWQSHAGVSNRGRSWFRVYNPVKSIEKIDPDGIFIRQWIPELADTSVEALSLKGSASLDYYPPIVDHQAARRRALAVLEPIKLKYQKL